MPDFVNYICPQFTRTHINFQRVPVVDTSNPFIALAALGVRRVSTGSALARAAYGSLVTAARELRTAGTFTYLDAAISASELDAALTS